MSFKYTYDQDDFVNASNVDIEELQNFVIPQSTITASINHIDMIFDDPIFTVDIYFDTELPLSEKAELDSIISNYQYQQKNDTVCILKDIKSAGTNGGIFTAGSWQTRTLNTLEGNVNFVTLNISTSEFTIQPGIYTLSISSPACNVQNHQIRLFNVTDNQYVMGNNAFSSGGVMTTSNLTYYEIVQNPTIYKIQHICSYTSPNIGFGRATGFNSEEVYTNVNIRRLGSI